MKLCDRDKVMFQTVFSGSHEECLALLGYLQFLFHQNIAEKILNHPLFSPSHLWKRWEGDTFVGFSLQKILIQGGHAMACSIEVGIESGPLTRLQKFWRGIKYLLHSFQDDFMKQGREPEWLSLLFQRHYPAASVLREHKSWFALHPNPYFRSLEAYLLRGNKSLPTSMLEIGGGACVNVAFYHTLNPTQKSVIVDLPETICAGYIFLRAVLPKLKVLLPHQVDCSVSALDYDVLFLLPTQTDLIPDESVDFCFNMSSFQEMEIQTVNNYLAFMCAKLRAGGSLVSVNQRVSRHIRGNSVDKYDFKPYNNDPLIRPAPFASALVGHVPGLEMNHLEIVKEKGKHVELA